MRNMCNFLVDTTKKKGLIEVPILYYNNIKFASLYPQISTSAEVCAEAEHFDLL